MKSIRCSYKYTYLTRSVQAITDASGYTSITREKKHSGMMLWRWCEGTRRYVVKTCILYLSITSIPACDTNSQNFYNNTFILSSFLYKITINELKIPSFHRFFLFLTPAENQYGLLRTDESHFLVSFLEEDNITPCPHTHYYTLQRQH